MQPLRIRIAEKEDLSELLKIYSSLEDGEGWNSDLTVAEATFNRVHQYPNFEIFVAEVDSVIVGTFELLIMDNLAHNGARSAIVEDVAVHPAWQGKGVGKAMMEYAMQRSREFGCYKMVLSSSLKRKDAHRFYQQIGFLQHGVSFCVEFNDNKLRIDNG